MDKYKIIEIKVAAENQQVKAMQILADYIQRNDVSAISMDEHFVFLKTEPKKIKES